MSNYGDNYTVSKDIHSPHFLNTMKSPKDSILYLGDIDLFFIRSA